MSARKSIILIVTYRKIIIHLERFSEIFVGKSGNGDFIEKRRGNLFQKKQDRFPSRKPQRKGRSCFLISF